MNVWFQHRLIQLWLIIGFHIASPGNIWAQSKHLSGFITDAQTGEALVGVSLVLKPSNQGTVSSQHGYFSIRIPEGTTQLVASSIGYQLSQIDSVTALRSVITIKLVPQATNLVETTVKADPQNLPSSQPGALSLSVKQLKKVPTLLGEADIMKALALTPGVNTGTEGTSGLLVRGGTPDQNLILLDGAPVYNVSHLFGLVSVFNADAIKHIDLYKGGFPARYGGRLSSVIDITMREGNNQKRSVEDGIGLVGARLLVEGPLHKQVKEKGSFLIAGRSSYLSLFTLPLRVLFNQGKTEQYANYHLYDFNGKLNYTLGKQSRVFASVYTGHDSYLSESTVGSKNKQSFRLGWGNLTATVRYNRAIKATLFQEATLLYTKYSYSITNQFLAKADGWEPVTSYNVRSSLRDWTLKNQWTFSGWQNHTLHAGVDITNHRFTPSAAQNSSSIFVDTVGNANRSIYANDLSAYIDDQFRLFSRFTVNTGLRGVIYHIGSKTYSVLEPRLSLNTALGTAWQIEAGYSRMNQFVHLLSSSGVGLPNDIWLPVTERLRPPVSDQIMLGLKANWPRGWLFSGDVYYKALRHLTDYQPGANFLANFNTDWEKQIDVNGFGTATGAEWMIRKTKGRLTGWVAYTLARNIRQFATINEGRPYAAPYDRRHAVSLFLDYTSRKGRGLTATWQYHSGDPTSVPVAMRENFGREQPVLIYGEKNNFRMPAYHRLDVVARFVHSRPSGRTRTWTIGIYNIYNRANPLYLDIKRRYTYASGFGGPFSQPTGTDYRLVSASLFQVIPVINYSFTY